MKTVKGPVYFFDIALCNKVLHKDIIIELKIRFKKKLLRSGHLLAKRSGGGVKMAKTQASNQELISRGEGTSQGTIHNAKILYYNINISDKSKAK